MSQLALATEAGISNMGQLRFLPEQALLIRGSDVVSGFSRTRPVRLKADTSQIFRDAC
jgi:hypothetical protein